MYFNLTFDPRYLLTAANREAIRHVKSRSYELLSLTPGEHVLDVGCGPAIDTLTFAKMVGPSGSVVGIDSDISAVSLAIEFSKQEGVNCWTDHKVADCRDLPFGDQTFDACYCERVLQHLDVYSAFLAFQEAVRVLRNNGRICVVDTDWPSLSIHSSFPLIERQIAHLRQVNCRNPYAARGLSELFHSFHLHDIRVETMVVPLGAEELLLLVRDAVSSAIYSGALSIPASDAWIANLRDFGTKGCFYSTVNFVICVGRCCNE